MNDPERNFVAEIQGNPDSEEARLIYADWLEERGDARAEFLRTEIEFSKSDPVHFFAEETEDQQRQYQHHCDLIERLAEATFTIDSSWLAEISYLYDIVMLSCGERKITTVKVIKRLMNGSLLNSINLIRQATAVVVPMITLEHAVGLLDTARSYTSELDAARSYISEDDAARSYTSELDAARSYISEDDAARSYISEDDGDSVFTIQRSGLMDIDEELHRKIARDRSIICDDAAASQSKPVPNRPRPLLAKGDLYLQSYGSHKFVVVKWVRELTELNTKESKNLVDSCPVLIRQGLSCQQQAGIASQLANLYNESEPPMSIDPPVFAFHPPCGQDNRIPGRPENKNLVVLFGGVSHVAFHHNLGSGTRRTCDFGCNGSGGERAVRLSQVGSVFEANEGSAEEDGGRRKAVEENSGGAT
jgi:uncharacterized protein (TIGR02996 family)